MAGRFSVEAVFKAIDRVTAPVSRMQNRVGKFTRSVERGFHRLDRGLDSVIAGAKKVGLAIVAAAAISTGALANVIGTGADFEQTLVSAAVKFPGEIRKGTQAFEELEKAARVTGGTTEFTATQSAEALNFLAMAGFNAQMAIAALPGVVDLATTAQVDLGTATDIATDSLGAFNMMSKDATQNQKNLARVSDLLALTSVRANTTIEDMFEAIKDGAPVGVAAGQSIETIAAMIGVMANAGIKGTRAGTGLKNIFLAMSAPGSAAAQVMRRLGIQTTKADGSIRDAVDVFEDFNKVAAKLPDSKKMQVFNEIFGKIPLAAAINLTTASGSLRSFRDELASTTGTTNKMAMVMRDTLQGRLNSLKSAVEAVKISIFKMESGPLNDVIDRMTQWVRANEQLIATKIGNFLAGIINNFESIVTWTKRIGIGIGVFFALSSIIKTLVGILTLFNLVMAANPITLLVVGVVALVAAFAALVHWIDDVVNWFENLPGPIRAVLLPIELLMRAIKFIKDNIGVVGDIASKVGDFMFGSGEDKAKVDRRGRPVVVSPEERVARSIEETRSSETAEVIIKDETGRAEMPKARTRSMVRLQQTGAL